MLNKHALDKALASYPDIRDKILARANAQLQERDEQFTKGLVTRSTQNSRRRSCIPYLGTLVGTTPNEQTHAQHDARQTEAINAGSLLSLHTTAQNSAQNLANNNNANEAEKDSSTPIASQDESGSSSTKLRHAALRRVTFHVSQLPKAEQTDAASQPKNPPPTNKSVQGNSLDDRLVDDVRLDINGGYVAS